MARSKNDLFCFFSGFARQDCHLGLAGSSLIAREVSSNSHLIKFSIYCGRETRENHNLTSVLNQVLESMSLNL